MKTKSYEMDHYEKIRALAPECMVLLKTDGSFPLEAPGKVALYGNGARRTIKGGTGSGDVNVRHFSTVEEGLEHAGFTITTKSWLDGYDAIWEQARKDFKEGVKQKIAMEGLPALMESIGMVMPEPEADLPLDGDGDTAIYVLARVSGEGSDRIADEGDFFLTDTETSAILQLQKKYPRFLLALNVGGVVDLSPVVDEVSNILLLGQTGIALGDAFADVLLGHAYPSGKLASTWAIWEDYCNIGDFGEKDDTRYREGIYVGYRWFDTVGKTPIFPFGYGLSYTTFSVETKDVRVDGKQVVLDALVKNTGSYSGKEVVQLYVSIPLGKLDQPAQVLAAFAKTDEIVPGAEQIVTLNFPLTQLASFDSDDACNILEHGQYVLYLGNSSRNTTPCAVLELQKDTIVRRLTHVGGTPDFIDWKPKQTVSIPVSADIPTLTVDESVLKEERPAQHKIDPAALEFAKSLTDSELAYLCVGNFKDAGSQSIIGNASYRVAGAAGETCDRLETKNVPTLVMADGPAGLRLSREYGIDENGLYSRDMGVLDDLLEMVPEPVQAMLGFGGERPERHGKIYEQYCVAIPVGTDLAQSWSEAVCEICGDLVGEEMERFGIHLWLAPALNIHRMPLCGRNYEYFSEDPLVSGKMAAAITRGTQNHPGCGVVIKHFCCNNQETNRMFSNSQTSERALRDIYLKGFEIAVKESAPASVMTSYNLLNGEHTSQRKDLCETVLRNEWGFAGVVMTDWVAGNVTAIPNKYPAANASATIAAGNDLFMPGGPQDYQNLMNGLKNGSVTRENLEQCAARVIELARALGCAHKKTIKCGDSL